MHNIGEDARDYADAAFAKPGRKPKPDAAKDRKIAALDVVDPNFRARH